LLDANVETLQPNVSHISREIAATSQQLTSLAGDYAHTNSTVEEMQERTDGKICPLAEQVTSTSRDTSETKSILQALPLI
jgi:hypothetical protein